MKKWLKRIRGAVGMGLTWAAAWAAVGGLAVVFGLGPEGGATFAFSLGYAFGLGVAGFIGGAAFSVVLGIAEGRRRFDEMSLPRFATWGAVGGLLFGVLWWPGTLVRLGIATLLGAGCAAGSLALARRADDRELLEHGADVSDIGLTEEEKRELLTG